MAQHLFEPRAPHVDPNGANAGDDAVGDDGASIGARVFEDVETDGIGAVGEVDIADLVVARGRTSVSARSAKSPCGSMTRSPSPRAMSWPTMLRRKVVLPTPVEPKIAMWRSRSSRVSDTDFPCEVSPMFVCGVIAGTVSEANATGRGGTT
jgi:hypothetical protein